MSVAACISSAPPFSNKTKVAHRIEPLKDSRWDQLIQRHPESSLFHSSAWLTALYRTYGYKPIAFTTADAGERLENGVVFCQVESCLTGRRLVSLPFSDHCDPLLDGPEDVKAMGIALDREFRLRNWRYIELRPLQPRDLPIDLPQTTIPYTLHRLDHSPSLEKLFRNCHKDSTQRKIRRAEREGLTYREGNSEELLNHFYGLHTVTRKRHHRPPQPRKWFRDLREAIGDNFQVRVAFHQNRAIAAIVTIRHKNTMVYKYGGSDRQYNHLGGMHILLWNAIQDAKAKGIRIFDFGRTEADQSGLITFKKRWGTVESELAYTRYGLADSVTPLFEASAENWKSRTAKSLLAHMQPGLLSLAGRILYKHVG